MAAIDRGHGSDKHFFSAGLTDRARSNVSSTYFSQIPSLSGLRTATNLRSDTLTALTTAISQVPTTAFTLPLTVSQSQDHLVRSGDSFADSPSTLSRAREIRRRITGGTSRSHSSGYQTEASQSNSSDKENDESMSGSQTTTGSYTYTPMWSASLNGSGSGSGGHTDSRSRTPTGKERSVRSESGSGSYASSGSYPGNGSGGSGSYTPRSGSS